MSEINWPENPQEGDRFVISSDWHPITLEYYLGYWVCIEGL